MWLSWGALLAFMVVGTVYVAVNLDLSGLHSLGIAGMIALLLIAVAYTWEATLGTYATFRALGHTTSLAKLYVVTSASFTSSYLVPAKAGVFAWLFLCKVFLKIPLVTSSAQAVIETSIGILINTIIALLGIGMLFTEHDPWAFAGVAGAIGLMLVLVLVLDLRPIEAFLDRWPRSIQKPGKRIVGFAVQFRQQIRHASSGWLLITVVLYLVRLGVRAFCLYLVFSSLGTQVPILTILFAQAISSLLGWISMLPLGIGVKDLTLIALLTAVGVSQEIAVLGALVDRVLWSVVPLVIGTVSAGAIGAQKILSEGTMQGLE
jgi:uncharacterized protein (TIRG00374 family)